MTGKTLRKNTGTPTKLFEAHKQFIAKTIGGFITSPKEITRRLASEKYAREYGFNTVRISSERVRKVINATPKSLIARYQSSYLADFSETPLAFKKNRVVEYTRLLAQVDTITKLVVRTSPDPDDKTKRIENISDVVKLELKLKILRCIKDEMGEDIEKLAEALRLGSNTINVNFTPALMLEVAELLKEEAGTEVYELDVDANAVH